MPITETFKLRWFSNGDYKIPFNDYVIEDDRVSLTIDGSITAFLTGDARKAFIEDIK